MATSKPIAVSEDKKWQAEDDMRTLQRAVEIVNDPKRYDAAVKMAQEKQKELALVSNGKSLRAALKTGGK